MVYLSGRHVST